MNNFFLTALTKAMNKYIELDPDSIKRLKHLQGKTIQILLLPVHLRFQCLFQADGIVITNDNITADTTISGTPLQMLGVLLSKHRQQFFADDLTIEGDVELGQQVVELFDQLQIDWEEVVAKKIGDVPSVHLSRLVKTAKTWFSDTEKSMSQNINEFVHEEAAWFPAKEALQDLFHDIDLLRMDVDRMESKIKYLFNNKDNE